MVSHGEGKAKDLTLLKNTAKGFFKMLLDESVGDCLSLNSVHTYYRALPGADGAEPQP